MKTIFRPDFYKNPCGRVLGQGEICTEGHLCDQCSYINFLENIVRENGYIVENFKRYDFWEEVQQGNIKLGKFVR